MPKFLWRVLGALFAACLLAAGPARAFDKGIDYRTLGTPEPTDTGNKVEVQELFWYGCPHCYHLEPELNRWLASKPSYVEFRRMPAVLGPNWAPLARAYYAADLLGVVDRIHEPLFNAIHQQHIQFKSDKALADWFASQGVKRADFLRAYHSFIVDMRVRRSAELGREMGIDGVPTFVVNGKYVTSPSMTGSTEKVFKVIDYLAAKEEGAAPKTAAAAAAPAAGAGAK